MNKSYKFTLREVVEMAVGYLLNKGTKIDPGSVKDDSAEIKYSRDGSMTLTFEVSDD